MWLIATIECFSITIYNVYSVCVLNLYYCKYIDLKFPTNKIKISLNYNVKTWKNNN